DRLLDRPHDKVRNIGAIIGNRSVEVADFYRLDPRWNFIAMMPQWDFLDFVAGEAAAYPNFQLHMGVEARSLIAERDRVASIVCRTAAGEQAIRARLVFAAHGRDSRLRQASG